MKKIILTLSCLASTLVYGATLTSIDAIKNYQGDTIDNTIIDTQELSGDKPITLEKNFTNCTFKKPVANVTFSKDVASTNFEGSYKNVKITGKATQISVGPTKVSVAPDSKTKMLPTA